MTSALMNVMIAAARKAARILLRDFGESEHLRYALKGGKKFVTAADLRAENILCEELSQARPDFDILAEERGAIASKIGGKKSSARWIIDPLDGSRNFVHGFPYFAISLACESDGEIIAGLIYAPLSDEMFLAEKGEGAYLNNQRIRASNCRRTQDGLFAYGRMNQWTHGILNIMRAGAHIRQMGSVSLSLAYVAAARLDGFLTADAKIWDVAAGIIIAREAGAIISALDGRQIKLDDKPLSLLACAEPLHQPLRTLLKNE